MNAFVATRITFLMMGLALIGASPLTASAAEFRVAPVVPQANEQIVRDELIIIVDETGSIGATRKFEYEKALVQGFVDGMPDGTYTSGLDSFAGVASSLWVKENLAPYSREVMVRTAQSLRPLGSLTPLARAIHSQEAELAANPGRGAILIFSDGKVRNPDDVLEACREMKAIHDGPLCIYTVQIGDSDRGRKLLTDMAAVNGCGKYYDAEDLNSAEAIQGVVRDIFLGAKEVPAPAPVPAPVAKTVDWTINNIEFDNDKSNILPEFNVILDEAITILKENPSVKMRLDGHTDFNASDAYNQKLSERRVNAVKAALVSRSADPNRLVTSAHGELQPTVPNDTPEHLHRNRRVELNVIK